MVTYQAPDESSTWYRHFLFLGLLTAFVNLLQAVSGISLGFRADSPLLLVFGLDAIVGGFREVLIATRIGRFGTADVEVGTDGLASRVLAVAYIVVGVLAFAGGASVLAGGRAPAPSFLGLGLAAISMLLIPIIGSYMKSLAMEVRSPALKDAAVFTFANSYLSMVLLIGLLVNGGMRYWWGDPVATLIMCPFIVQKGIQILVGNRDMEFSEGE